MCLPVAGAERIGEQMRGGKVTGMGWPDHVDRQMDFGFDFQ